MRSRSIIEAYDTYVLGNTHTVLRQYINESRSRIVVDNANSGRFFFPLQVCSGQSRTADFIFTPSKKPLFPHGNSIFFKRGGKSVIHLVSQIHNTVMKAKTYVAVPQLQQMPGGQKSAFALIEEDLITR